LRIKLEIAQPSNLFYTAKTNKCPRLPALFCLRPHKTRNLMERKQEIKAILGDHAYLTYNKKK
jgi:hypothetical protein